MTIRAWAFHQAISFDRLEELLKSDVNQLFSGTLAGRCSGCGLRFGIFFPAKGDPENDKYLAKVQAMILEDCHSGKHRGEYILHTTP
jgi:hypothetical protein